MAVRDILDRQANTIEYVLHTHGITQAYVDGGKLSPRLAHFRVVLPPGVRPRQLSPMVPEIAEALGVMTCRLASGEEGVYIEVPRHDPVPVRLLSLVQRVADVVPPVTATLGLDTESTPLLLRLNAPDVDPVLVSGDRGAGKSNLLRAMALSLALHNSPDRLRLLLVDCSGEGKAFRGMEHLPHLACPIALGPVDGLLGLRWAMRVLSRRSHMGLDDELTFDDDDESEDGELLFEYNAVQVEEPPLVIMIDGADTLCASGNRRADAEVLGAMSRLLSEGTRHDIHMVVSTEGSLAVSANWGARISGALSSPEAARLAMGMKGSGAQGLLGAGDFLVSLNAELIRFQSGAVSEAEVGRAVELIIASAENPPPARREEKPTRQARPGRAPEREHPPEQPVQLRRSWLGD